MINNLNVNVYSDRSKDTLDYEGTLLAFHHVYAYIVPKNTKDVKRVCIDFIELGEEINDK